MPTKITIDKENTDIYIYWYVYIYVSYFVIQLENAVVYPKNWKYNIL